MPEGEGKVLQWLEERDMVVIESLGTGQVASTEERRFYGRDPKDHHHVWGVPRRLRKGSQRE